MGFIKSTKINFKIILSGYSEPEAEWMRFRASDWKVWFVASGNGCIVKHSAFSPQALICHMYVFTFKSTILIYANSMGVCVDVMLCIGGLCFDYLQICTVGKLGSFEHCLNRHSGWNSSCTGHDTGLPEGIHTGRVKGRVSWKKVASVATKRMSSLLSLTSVGVDILPWDVAFCTQKHQRNEPFSRKGHLFCLDMSGWSTNFASLDSLLVRH